MTRRQFLGKLLAVMGLLAIANRTSLGHGYTATTPPPYSCNNLSNPEESCKDTTSALNDPLPPRIPGYKEFLFPDFDNNKWPVFYTGNGPAILILHEITGLTPDCVAFGARLAEAGFTVYLPLLFGSPLQDSFGSGYLQVLSSDLNLYGKTNQNPLATWLSALCTQMSRECGNRGIGVIGMCLTGNLVIPLLKNRVVVAPIMSQPAIPLITPTVERKRALGVSDQELGDAKQRVKEDNLTILGFRFTNDCLSPPERFDRLQDEFGKHFHPFQIKSPDERFLITNDAHAVLTKEYRSFPADHPTRCAFTPVVDFMKSKLL